MTIKNLLNTTLQNLLSPMREKRASLKQEYIKDILSSGTQKARKIATQTIEKVRDSIGLRYF
jgi:tryptophanyl-tRNA synthetase